MRKGVKPSFQEILYSQRRGAGEGSFAPESPPEGGLNHRFPLKLNPFSSNPITHIKTNNDRLIGRAGDRTGTVQKRV